MSRFFFTILHGRVLAVCLGVILSVCARPEQSPAAALDITDLRGTVFFSNLEGGFYAIRGDDRVTYDPINLPAAFRRDGLRVVATLRIRRDLAGTHMVGPIVEVVRIDRMNEDVGGHDRGVWTSL